jgi:hypothetical protein
VRERLHSYRFRRRLTWSAVALASVVALALLIVLLPKGGGRKPLPIRKNEPAQVYEQQKAVRVTSAQRHAVNETLLSFIRTGLTRNDPEAAWDLVTPTMRSGISRADWNSGQLPVFPYPAQVPKRPEWNVITSYKGDLTVDLLLQPRQGTKWGPVAFAVELKQHRGRWLIDSMAPEHIFAPVESKPKKKPSGPQPLPKPEYPHGKLSPLWFAIPAGLLGLVIVVPLLIALLAWRRSRAIERRYRNDRL